jgi:hypothetical protein
MYGDETATVRAVRPFELHGLPWWDVSIELDGGRLEEVRLGDEAVPGGLAPGDRVRVARAGLVVIGLARET